MKILLTGAHGFVGKHFLQHDLGADHIDVIDIKDGNDVRDFFRSNTTRYDLVIHLAAVVGGRALIEGSPLALAVDLAIDAEMAQWALRTRPGHILYFSSSAAYPISLQRLALRHTLEEGDIDLEAIRNPDMTYGWAKLTGEMLMNHLRKENLTITTLRPFSGYGATQDLDYPFPSFIERGMMRADPFDIWGSGSTVRDWIHITDIVRASMVMARRKVNEPVNLATGIGHSFRQLANIVSIQVGYRPEYRILGDKPKGVEYRVGSPRRMMDFYTPEISLAEGVALALNAYAW
ncbi:MAG: NAD-dependent epimerase/dehydratase family protein [Micrococcales bacterium]|nr:NAD-dependent epimerase/dehydratase family protein [Micrococcales bacterium]